ncbi:hypothetical protein REPUB_Repub03eG0002000 [Reevesia pubescens]
MIGITGACSRLMGEILHALGGSGIRSAPSPHIHPISPYPAANYKPQAQAGDDDYHHHPPSPPPLDDDLILRALTAVFGMDQTNCRINKEKARQVVQKLGLVDQDQDEDKHDQQHTTNFDLPGGGGLDDYVPVEEVLGVGGLMELDGSNRNELLRQAFTIFDEDGNGFIDALELKRVLQCLGLDNGWDMSQIENMLKVVDSNLDGKVDFNEFQLMMMTT